jgi:hypothetical protein
MEETDMKKVGLLAVLTAFLGMTVCAQQAPAPGGQLYTAYNIWYEHPEKIPVINYMKGAMLPAGTAVKNVTFGTGLAGFGKSISFQLAKSGESFTVVCSDKFYPGRTLQDFRDRLFTAKPLAELTKGFTAQELRCVKNGSFETGISRASVRVIYGYPPEHVNRADGRVWTIWKSRFGKLRLDFDDSDHVTRIEQ